MASDTVRLEFTKKHVPNRHRKPDAQWGHPGEQTSGVACLFCSGSKADRSGLGKGRGRGARYTRGVRADS